MVSLKKISSTILIISLVFSLVPFMVLADEGDFIIVDNRNIMEQKNDGLVKTYIDRYQFTNTWTTNSDIQYAGRTNYSGWISDEVGGSITTDSNYMLNIADTSSSLPVSFKKEIEKNDIGNMVLTFSAGLVNSADNYRFMLCMDDEERVGIYTNGNIYVVSVCICCK